jgi:hypothetical protein
MPYTLFDIGACNCGPPPACNVTVCVTAACITGVNAPGLPVTVTNSGGTVVASGTTGSNGCVTLTIPAAGTYTFAATDANGDVATDTATVACGSTISLAFHNAGFMVCANTTGPLVCTVTNFVVNGTPIPLTDAQNAFDLELFVANEFWSGSAPNDLSNPLFSFNVQVDTNNCLVTWGFETESFVELDVTSFTCSPFTIVGTFFFNQSSTVTGTVTITL